MKTGPNLSFAIIVFLLTAVVSIKGMLDEHRISTLNFIKTKAYIERKYTDSEQTIILVIRYKNDHGIEYNNDIGEYMHKEAGDSIEIIYNSADPYEVFPPNQSHRSEWGIFLFISMVSFIYICYWTYYYLKPAKSNG